MRFFLSLLMVLLLVGCSENLTKDTGTVLKEGDNHISKEMEEVISNYIIQKYSSVYLQTEKLFEVHKVYGTSELNSIISVYMYSYFGGFNKSTGLENQAGHSLPAVIRLQKKSTGYSVIEYTETKDGNQYHSSLEKMFPDRYLKMAQQDVGNIEDLQKEMDNKVKHWLEEPFTASISVHNQFITNEVFIVEATLKNLSDKDFTILHAARVFYFYIKHSNGKGVNTFVMEDVGIVRTFQGKGTITEKYTYRLKKPGLYEVSATAKFTVGEGDNEKDFEIETNKASFEVIP
jgi:hypothetical protein